MRKASSDIAIQTAAAATISGHLFRASLIAKHLALAAKNSRAGLKVISDYFDDLAGKTINLSTSINKRAISISRTSVRQWRTQTFLDRMDRSQSRLAGHKASQLTPSIDERQHYLSSLIGTLQTELKSLQEQLADINQYMQSSSVVAVTFKLEATQTGEFQPLLEDMAKTINGHSNDIKYHITNSQKQLSQFHV